MFRALLLIGFTSLWGVLPALGHDDGADAAFDDVANDGSLISFSHDPECPGCRAFLSGCAANGDACGCTHTPSCAARDNAVDPPSDDPALGEELLAADYGVGFGFESASPGMIGDFFGGSYKMSVVRAGQRGPTGIPNGPPPPREFTNVPTGGGDRRFKIAENYSPFPVDRVFFNYNHFHNALQTAYYRQANLNRMTMGVEKTFLDRWWSFELRMPFSSGLNSDQTAAFNPTTANNVTGEIGNLGFVLKRLLSRSDTLATSAGLGMIFPTGPEARIYDTSGTHVVTIENQAFYLQPFVGAWWTPNDRLFAQFAVQADYDTRGNDIDYAGDRLGAVATIQDQALLFLDASFGYWLFHDPSGDAVVTGLAPMVEIHHNSTIEDTDFIQNGPDVYTNPDNRLDVLNLTGALRLELAGMSYLTIFGVAPLRQDEEKLFDAEFGAQYTRFY